MKKLLFTLLISAATCGFSSAAKQKAAADESDAFFASPEVLRIKIEIPPEGIETLSRAHFNPGATENRESVNATVREGENVYTQVALHLKGAAGSFRPVTDNPAMTLNFDKNVKKQRFHGLEKLSLNNSVQDPSLISEQFCREMFAKAGIPVPRATHALVELNGRPLGLYVLVEGFNKQFLKRHFQDPNGHLYDGGFLKDITNELALNSGKDPADQADRKRLVEAVQEPNLAKRLERLNEVLDVDRFITYLALDTMLWNWDGYAQNRNNWRLYHDPSTDKMTFLPHGLDQMLWNPEGSILPRMQGMVAKRVLQLPELRERYFARMTELRTQIFQAEAMTNRAYAIAAKIRPVLEKEDKDRAADQQRALAKFCNAIVKRAQSIDSQLAHPITPTKFDASGTFVLSDWQSKNDFGRPTLKQEGEALVLGADDGSSIGTWRSKVWLEPGRYKIEGRLKTRDIVGDPGDTRPGAGLRFGRGRSEKYVSGTSSWQPVEHEFSIDDPLLEVQVMCEFRGASGEATFDSLKLRRLPAK